MGVVPVGTVVAECGGVQRREGDVLTSSRIERPTMALARRVVLELSCGHQPEIVRGKRREEVAVVVAMSKREWSAV